MINEQVINDTIKRMLDSGIDDATIISTLTDIGISQGDAQRMVASVKQGFSGASSAPSSSQVAGPSPSSNISDELAAQKQSVDFVKTELETRSQMDALNQGAVHNVLDMHGQKLDEVSQKVDEVRQTLSGAPLSAGSDPMLATKLSELEAKVDDINAGVTALREVLKKILETDRQILTDLEAKK